MPLTINGERLPDRELDRELLRLSQGLEMDAPHAGGTHPAEVRSAAMRAVVGRTLLLQAAAQRRLRVTAAEVEAERHRRWGSINNSMCGTGVSDAIAQDLLLARVQADLTRHVPRPSRAAVEAFYCNNRQRFHQAEAVDAAHIFCASAPEKDDADARATLAQAEAELNTGKPFAQVANRYSDCKGVAGAVGWVTRGTMVHEFEDVVFALAAGQRSAPFRTVFGWHIAMVGRRRAAGYQPLEAVRLQIAGELFAAARSRELMHQLAQLERGSTIRFEEEAHG